MEKQERYEVVVAVAGEFYGHRGGNWQAMPHDDAPDGYTTEDEAWEAVRFWEELDQAAPGYDPDAPALYSVSVCGARWPLVGAL